MQGKKFVPTPTGNHLVHPPSCACVRCAAGRKSQELDESLLAKVLEMLDATFLAMVQGNVAGGHQMLAQGQPPEAVRAGFVQNMHSIMLMREIAASYFADEESNGDGAAN